MPRPAPPPPPTINPLFLLVWLYRPLGLLTAKLGTVGRRWARQPVSIVLSLTILAAWADAGNSQVLWAAFLMACVATLAHAAHPAPSGHTLALGGGAFNDPVRGRMAECVLAVTGGVVAGECGDPYARGYFVAAGLSGLILVGALALRERNLRDDLSDGAIDASSRF